MDATLAILQRFVRSRGDGWTLALDTLESEAGWLPARCGRLGEVTAAMHTTLASDASDPNFAAEEPSAESLALLSASVDEEIEQVFLSLPDNEAVAPIAGRGEEVRDRLRLLTNIGPVGRVIRHHGDYHLGQVLWSDDEDWIVLDFEGEPARSLPERRRKRSPLRDVAGMLRSFAYVSQAAPILRGTQAPDGWEERCRQAFLDAYLSAVDPTLLPVGENGIARLLSVFELEKAVYELRYELAMRPDWVDIPVAGILRILEGEL
jgi:trehalose synthase-fused probable maltokinase